MEIFHSFVDIKHNKKTAVTVGKFDGLHLGHDILIKKIVQMKKNGLSAAVVTFDGIRLEVEKTGSDKVLMTKEEKYELLEHCGVDILLELPFNESLKRMAPQDFIGHLIDNLGMEYIIAGSDFTFGYKGAGNADMLKEIAKKMSFSVEIIDKLKIERQEVSSTLIRKKIACGDIKTANNLLGYNYFVLGSIVHGNGIGRQGIGHATINIDPPKEKLLPPNGVYVTEVRLLKRRYFGVTNIGEKPTIPEKNKHIGIETHILNFDGNVYDKSASVSFLYFIREEKKFESLEALKKQIEKDICVARDFFNKRI